MKPIAPLIVLVLFLFGCTSEPPSCRGEPFALNPGRTAAAAAAALPPAPPTRGPVR